VTKGLVPYRFALNIFLTFFIYGIKLTVIERGGPGRTIRTHTVLLFWAGKLKTILIKTDLKIQSSLH
jgi:hypothetical protein